jgi:dTDP-4-amino-4,6-dideoxygalactose transaminase
VKIIPLTPPNLPAIAGGRPIFAQRLPIVSPEGMPGEDFVRDIRKIIGSRQLTNGSFVLEFESMAADYLGVPHCVAVSSCTSGLMLTLRVLGLTGEAILPSFTFHATAHSIVWNGLKPVFADCDPEGFCISPASVRERLSPKTAAILAVHIFGNPANVTELQEIAASAQVALIYDSAHAFGSTIDRAHVGSFGVAEVFSFSPTKLLVAGEGGLVATHDANLAQRLRAARNYGDAGNSDPECAGLNARMSEFHAALALRGLEGLDTRVDHRNEVRLHYEERLREIPGLSFQKTSPGNRSSCKDFQILVDEDAFGRPRDWLFDALRQENIEVRRYFWPPVHRQKLYRAIWDGRPLPVTDQISDRVVSLPIYSSLREDDVAKVCDAIERAHLYAKRRDSAKGHSA